MQGKTPDPNSDSSARRPFVGWLVVGVLGVLAIFVASVFLPDTVKIPGVFAVLIAALAGWGLGRWGLAMNIQPTMAVAIAAWLAIAGGEVVSTVKTNRDRVNYLRKQPKYQDAPDDIVEGLKRALEAAPANQTEKDRRRWQDIRDDIERGEAKRKDLREQLTFFGFLQGRIPKTWGKWNSPWPAAFWVAEVVIGSTLGAWLALSTLRNVSPAEPRTAGQIDSSQDGGSGDRT